MTLSTMPAGSCLDRTGSMLRIECSGGYGGSVAVVQCLRETVQSNRKPQPQTREAARPSRSRYCPLGA
jgi:hypothetical protein